MKFKLITHIDRINYISDNFIAYYKRFFREDEFYFLVHNVNSNHIRTYLNSHGFTTDQMMFYKTDRFGWGDNIKMQNDVKTKWLNEGYVVLYADPDERIFHPDLRTYIADNLTNWIVPTGVSLMQHDSEPPLDESKLVLEQRSYGKIDIYWFSKTCILAKDYEWLPGRHTKPHNKQIDPNVYLIDIGKMCKDFMLKNNEESKKIYKKLFWRYSTDKKDVFKNVFNEHKGNLEPLPKSIKDSLLF